MAKRTIANCRDEFPICQEWTYLNHASMSPIPRCCADAIAAAADTFAVAGPTGLPALGPQVDKARVHAARLMGVDAHDVAFVLNTTSGVSIVANGLDWRPGDNVVAADIEYPANVYPWMAQRRRGVGIKWVKSSNGRLNVDDYAAAIDSRTRVLSVSTVEFTTGFRNNIAALGELCRERGVLLVVDCIQSLGALVTEAEAWNVDVMTCGGHKWLLSMMGAGLLYCRPEALEQIGTPNAGADSMANVEPYLEYDFTPKPNAQRFESGCQNIGGILALSASMALLNELGPANIQAHIRSLTGRACDGLKAKGYRVYSSREEGEWSNIVAFESGERDGAQIVDTLKEQKIIISLREGSLRISPHCYNTEDDIGRCIAALP